MRRLACLALAVLLAEAGCRRAPKAAAAGSTRAPKGDVVWFADPVAVGEPGIEESLQRIGAAAVFLPAGEIAFEGGRWTVHADTLPPRRLERIPAVLVLRARPEIAGGFGGQDGSAAKAMAGAVAAALKPSLDAGGPYGRVTGVHLDFPFSGADAPGYAEFVKALRGGFPPGIFVSIALGTPPSVDAERNKLQPLLESADALVAFAFRDGETVPPAAVDALRRPWWPAFGTAGHGVLSSAGGGPSVGVAERFLDPLSGSPRADLANDLSQNDPSVSAFHIAVRERATVDGLSLNAGDRIDFRLPSQTELLFQLGSVLAGRHFALGRLIEFEGASDAERILPVAAFEDVLLGRSLTPEITVSARALGRNAVSVDAVNLSTHPSIVSRVSNWVEVDIAPARPADVQLGGFDRYEVYDSNGRPVTPGRATRVRLFETMIGPRETVSTARIVVRGALPKSCCPYRVHSIAAAGPEIVTDWVSPPPPPTPTPRPAKKKTR